jgi:long-subunit fatty acid transport protein
MRKLILAASIAAPAVAHAGGYIIPDENARTLALSQADLADQTGAETMLVNPAAAAGQVGFDVSASLEWLDNRTEWSDPTLGSASLLSHANFPPATAITYGDVLPNHMAWGAGIGFDIPAGGSLHWPTGWAGQQYVQDVDQNVYEVTAGGGFQPCRYIRLGAAYVLYHVTEQLSQGINFVDHYGEAQLGMSGTSSSVLLSADGKVPRIPLKLAVSFKYKGSMEVAGNAHFTDVPAEFSTTLQDQRATEQFALPSELHVGAAYDVTPGLTAMFTFTNEFWSTYHSDTFVGSTGFTVTVPRNYNNAQVYRLAAEWAHVPFLRGLTLRLGGLRSVSSQPTTTLSPSLTDGDSWAVSFGAGYDVMANLRIDLGYQHAFFDTVTATGIETLPGTYNTQVDLLSLGLNWRFGVPNRTK